mmetsp:Transcript_152632/g.370463  ORF Transcript_152632/g.370463 Transcript_152632/m.370463 type:complete len:97 (-) Transcript_152632:696-986(-)
MLREQEAQTHGPLSGLRGSAQAAEGEAMKQIDTAMLTPTPAMMAAMAPPLSPPGAAVVGAAVVVAGSPASGGVTPQPILAVGLWTTMARLNTGWLE